MYITKISKAGGYVFIKKYSPRRYGAPSKKRTRRMRDTPRAMEKYNNQKRAEHLQQLMILNFDKGFHVILDYPKGQRPETYEEAETNLRKCLYKVSRRFKKRGKSFKYIAVTEKGKRAAALHHHLIVEGYSEVVEELTSVWGYHIKINQMYEEGLYKDLAEYIVKAETKEEQTKGKSKYHRSRNLKEPTVRVSFSPGTIKDDPEVPRGYHMVQDSLRNGYNEVLGIRYQSYVLQREQTAPKKHSKECTKRESVWDKIKNIFKRRR